MSCPSQEDILRVAIGVAPKESEAGFQKWIDIETHIKLCPDCQKLASARIWAEMKKEQIDGLPLLELKARFEKALGDDNAAELELIVKRLCQSADFCVDILIEAAEKAPGAAGPSIREFLGGLKHKIDYQLWLLRVDSERRDRESAGHC